VAEHFGIEEYEKVYTKWLWATDLVPVRAALAHYVANEILDGDPVNLMVVGGSGSGKTEDVRPIGELPHCRFVSSITSEAALLSASRGGDDATGGILVAIGTHGVLVIKDFTTILQMRRESREQVIAALREVADGFWARDAGFEGGRHLEWHGKIGILAASTTAIDSAHSIMATMGARWLFVRKQEADRDELALRALQDSGREEQMRGELVEAVRTLFDSQLRRPHDVTYPVERGLVALANLTTVARSPVERDYRRIIVMVHDREAPTRVVKALAQMYRACGVIGLDEADSWEVVQRLAADSMPKIRRCIVRTLMTNRQQPDPSDTSPVAPLPHGTYDYRKLQDDAKNGVRPPDETWTWASTSDVATSCQLPRSTVKEALEDLMVHGLAKQWQQEDGEEVKTRPYWWRLSDEALTWLTTWQAVDAEFRRQRALRAAVG
jgi:hypothetical protein